MLPERRVGVDLTWADLRPDEMAGRHRNVTKARLRRLAERVPRRYRPRCRRVAQHADGRAANPFESVLRALAIEAGLDVTAQMVIGVGTARVRPDVVDESRRLVLEADSYEFHGKRAVLLRDCERYIALVVQGWTVLRFGWEHVMLHPDYVLGCLRDVTARQPLRRAVTEESCDIPA